MSALARFTSFDPRPRLAGFGPARPGPDGARAGGPPRLGRGRRRRLVLRSGLAALAASLLVAGGLAALSGLLASRPASGQALATMAGAARWAEIRRPLALYGLAGTEFSKLPASYRARRREPDGAREDVMTFGALGDAKPFLQVSLLRADAAPAGEADGLDDGLADRLARLAGSRGLTATRIHPAAAMDTRLGRFDTADLLLWDGAAATPCLGFRSGGDGGAALHVAGFACGSPARPMGRAALACTIDRIDLVSAGDDAALRAVFVAAERRREVDICPGGSALVAAGTGGRSLGWLDPGGALPPLRGLFEATVRRR